VGHARQNKLRLAVIAVALALAILAVDLSLPLGVAGGVPYVSLVLLGWWFGRPRYIFLLAAISSVLTVVGYFYSSDGGIEWVVLTNRFLAFFAIWVTAALLAKVKGAELALQIAHKQLEQQAEAALRETEERFRAVVNNSPMKIHIKDVEGRYVLVNREAEKLFGVTEAEALGKTTHDIFPDKRADEFKSHDQSVLETGQTVAEEEEWLRGDDVYTFLTVKFPILDSLGGIRGVGAIGTDITERKRAEKLSQRLGRILDSSFNEIYVFDAPTYRFTQVNRGALSNLGYTMEELSHMTPWDLKLEFDEESFGAMVEPLFRAEKEMLVFETEHRRKNGSSYPVEVRLQLSKTETPPVFVAVIADITERKQAEEAIHAAKEEAEVANRAKSEFLAAMSHELRTPLNAILGFSEIIKDETFGPVGSVQYRDYAEDIHSSGKHLLGLINDILDLSKIESGAEELHEDRIEIPEFIHSVLKLVGQRAGQEAVKLQLEIADHLPALRADERKLTQILVNLLSNAIKFSDSGGEVALWAWCQMSSGHVFQIIDTGIGIAPENIAKALSRFGQVDGDLNRRYQGTGLGLPLTKALIELHGGTLNLQSQVGVGTIITVRLPVERIVRSPHDATALNAADRKAG
jgi:PAS domain S-box-containing protein